MSTATTVAGIYTKVLQRDPTAAESATWVTLLDGKNATIADLTNTLIASPEATNFVDPVVRVYQAVFGRVPDQAGLDFWVDAFRNGTSLATITEGFVQSAEFAARYGTAAQTGTVTTAYIQELYQNILGRAPDAAGFAFWLGANVTPAQMLELFSGSAENVALADPPISTFLGNLANGVAQSGSLYDGASGIVGQTIVLSPNVDNVKGTVFNDTFVAGPQFVAAAGNFVAVLNASDVINGGAGTDTLSYVDDAAGGFTLPGAKLTSVENVTVTMRQADAQINVDVQASADVRTVMVTGGTASALNIDTKSNVTAVTLTKADVNTTASDITDNGTAATTADTLASVTLIGTLDSTAGGPNVVTIQSDALKSLSVQDTAFGATVLAATATRELALNLNNVTGGTFTDATATSVAITASGKASSGLTVTTDAATTVTVAGDVKVSLSLTDAAAVAPAQLSSVTSTNTAGTTIANQLNNATSFTGGTGKDSVTVAATTKTIDMGAGDDTVTLAGGTTALGVGGALKGGDGVDTLSFTNSADAATASATATFKAGVSQFEKVQVGTVAALATDVINLANLNDINYVKSSGTQAGTGAPEIATLTFSGLLSGQSITINDGNGNLSVYTAAATQTAAQVAAAVQAAVDLTGYTDVVGPGGNTVVFTSTTNAQQPNVSIQGTAAPTAPTVPTVVTTQGVTAVAGTTESSVVTFQGLLAGEAVTAAGRTFTAGLTETQTLVFTALTAGQTFTVSGLTITAGGAGATIGDVRAAVAAGADSGGAAVTGGLVGFTAAANIANGVTLTSTAANTNVAQVTVTGANAGTVTVATLTEGAGSATAAQVATAMSGGAVVAGTLTGGLVNFTAGGLAANAVTFTSTTATSNVTDIVVTTTAGTAPTVVTTQGVAAIAGVTESAVVTFNALTDGQSVTVAGRTVTANGGNLSAEQVADGFFGGVNAGFVNVSGTLAGFTVANAAAGDANLEFTSVTATTNVTDITRSVTNAPAPAAPTVTVVDGSATAGGGSLQITQMGANGTLELTGVINGASSVALKDATGAADVFNIILNGTSNIVNTAVTTVSGVETINITATDSSSDATALTNPGTASTILLNAAAAKTVMVMGNHGVNFTGSTLGAVTLLDASGVNATFATGGTPANAAAAATAATVTFTSTNTTEAVTIKGGNGNDALTAATGSTKVFTIDGGAGNDVIIGAGGADVLTGGDGNDNITGGAGADVLTGGAGSDAFILAATTDSTLASRDRITDFVANTVGNGAAGAANNTGAVNAAANYNGDVIDLTALGGAGTLIFSVQANAANATTFVANGALDGVGNINIALDSSTGFLYIDIDDNGVADSVIELTGVTTLTTAAFQI
jgi:hypothetical protein